MYNSYSHIIYIHIYTYIYTYVYIHISYIYTYECPQWTNREIYGSAHHHSSSKSWMEHHNRNLKPQTPVSIAISTINRSYWRLFNQLQLSYRKRGPHFARLMQSSYRGSECSKYVSMSIPSWRGHGKVTNRFPPVIPGERLFQADVASQNMHIWTWLGCVDTATWTNPGTPWYPNHNMHCHHCRISSSSEPQRLVRPVTAFDNRGIRHDEMEKKKARVEALWNIPSMDHLCN
jgi:hypothetical protein